MTAGHRSTPHAARTRAYTLVEILVVVVILGIAGALAVPTFSQTGVLRVQGAVRLLVCDITQAQSDALAYQRGRAIRFFPGQKHYQVGEVRGTNVDWTLDLLTDRTFTDNNFGDSDIAAANFATANTLVFDELGSPVTAPGSGIAAGNGTVDITGSGQSFRITIEAYTGRATVQALRGP